MSRELLFLKQNVQVEPLVDQWYAWSHLLSPATMARNLTERHFKIMESYISAPAVHAAAVKTPRMRGGPFMDYPQERVEEIRALQTRTKRERRALIELSQALVDLDVKLCTQATGFSLRDWYPLVPQALRGYVELVYDLNNHPSFRLLEPLLYRSRYQDHGAQSLMLSLTTSDDRPFVLSTPRLESEHAYHWRVPFRDNAVDTLFRLKTQPMPLETICDIVGVRDESRDLFRRFLTPDPPRPYVPYRGATARWRYFGHACVLVETPTTSIMFDPVLSYTYEGGIPRYTYEDLPDTIDFVVITHNHQDHLLFETLLQLRHKVGTVVVPRGNGSLQDPSMMLLLKDAGFDRVQQLDELDELTFDGGSITAVPFLGEHSDLDIRSKAAYVVRLGEHVLMFAADSCNIEPTLYRHLREHFGPVDVLFLGMECNGAPLTWLYGPLLSRRLDREMDQSRRLAGSNFEQAWDIVATMGCDEVYVYAMGQEPWLNYVMSIKYTEQSRPIVESNRLIDECRRRGMTAERLFGEREMFVGRARAAIA